MTSRPPPAADGGLVSRQRPMSGQVVKNNTSQSGTQIRVGFTSILGRRLQNEDREVKFQCDDLTVAAVFDGHNGKFASEFCFSNLQKVFEENCADYFPNIETVLKKTIASLNDQLSYYSETKECGTTAVVAVVDTQNELISIVNVGDSRFLVGKKDGSFEASQDHKPDIERDRLQLCGAQVDQDANGIFRVNGSLSISRTLGDTALKPCGVIAEADFYQYSVNDCSYILIACDGFWDVVNCAEADELMRGVLAFQPETELQRQFYELYNGKQDDAYAYINVNNRPKRVQLFENVNPGLVREKRISQALSKFAYFRQSDDNVSVAVAIL